MNAAVDTSVDWALLEAEMPSIPCEHALHNATHQAKYHGGEATHFCRLKCQECGVLTRLTAVCAAFVTALQTKHYVCTKCGHEDMARTFIQTLQPIKATR